MARLSQYEIQHYARFRGKRIIRVELVYVHSLESHVPTFFFDDGTFCQVWASPSEPELGAGWLSLHRTSDGEELAPQSDLSRN